MYSISLKGSPHSVCSVYCFCLYSDKLSSLLRWIVFSCRRKATPGHILYDPEEKGRKPHFVWELYREVFDMFFWNGMTGICPRGSAFFSCNTINWLPIRDAPDGIHFLCGGEFYPEGGGDGDNVALRREDVWRGGGRSGRWREEVDSAQAKIFYILNEDL